MNEDDQFEDFLLPVEGTTRVKKDEMISGGVLPVDSPTRRLTSMLSVQYPKVPESPDMKFARKRLGHLLTNIKHHPQESQGSMNDENLEAAAPVEPEPKQKPGRPRKVVREKASTSPDSQNVGDQNIMFEFRGRPFDLVAGRKEIEYSLCRAWVRGSIKKEPTIRTTLRTEYAPNLSVDYLASREIHKMPKSLVNVPKLPIKPVITDKFDTSIDPDKIGLLRIEYARHWKAIKKSWLEHEKKKKAKFATNIALLEKIFTPPDMGAN